MGGGVLEWMGRADVFGPYFMVSVRRGVYELDGGKRRHLSLQFALEELD